MTVVGNGATAMLTAVANGSAAITAKTSDGGHTATCNVTVRTYNVPVTGITLNNTSLEVLINATGTLTASLTPSNAPTNVSWTSSSTGVATVSGTGTTGTITPVAAGATTITAAAGGKTATCAVTIRVIPVTAITLPATMEIRLKGGAAPITATLLPSNATDRNVTWSTGNSSIVTVSGTGTTAMITPVAEGTATITARAGGFIATCSVTVEDKAASVKMPYMTMSAGYERSMGIKADGSLWAWGSGSFSALGLGSSTSNVYALTQVGTDKNWVSVTAYGDHSAALKSDGTLWVWGRNNYGQLGLGTSGSTNQTTPIKVNNDTDWAAVAAAQNFTMALKTDGTLWCWGRNNSGQLGIGSSGSTTQNSPRKVNDDTDWAMVATWRANHTAAIKSDGSLWAWGSNGQGQVGDGTLVNKTSPTRVGTDNDWASVKVGSVHTVAQKTDGSIWAWGFDYHGQLALGIEEDETPRPNPIRVPVPLGTGNWMLGRYGVGDSFVVAQKTDGSVWSWGENYYGALGVGDDEDRYTPVRVGTAVTNWAFIAGGNLHALYVRADGSLYVVGSNNNGQLGLGNTGSGTYSPDLRLHSVGGWRVPTD